MTLGPLKGAKMIVPTKLPPEGWVAPTRGDLTFYCFPWGCAGVKAETCVTRQKRINRASKEPYFGFCNAKCVQGQMVRAAIGEVPATAPDTPTVRKQKAAQIAREHHLRKRTDPALRDEIVERISVLGMTVERAADAAGVRRVLAERLVAGEPVSGFVWRRMEMATGLLTVESEGM
jgi:hypothetical protein